MLRKIIFRLIFLMVLATGVLLAIAHKTDADDSLSTGKSEQEARCESGKRSEFLLLEAIISVVAFKNKQ